VHSRGIRVGCSGLYGICFRVQGLGFGVYDPKSSTRGSGFRVKGLLFGI